MQLKNSKFDELARQVLQMNYSSIARAISICEKNDLDGFLVVKALGEITIQSHVIGVTGAPGVGKSTLIDCIAHEFLNNGDSVAVLSIDPNLYKQQGAFLGDRVRMSKSQAHPRFFLRSISSRGMLGGLNPSFIQILLVLIAAKFTHIIIETVGVGQSENLVKDYVQTTIAVHAPDQGDDIQYLKGGIISIGDIQVVNKADILGADRVLSRISSAFKYQKDESSEEKCKKIFLSQASNASGITDLVSQLQVESLHPNSLDYKIRVRNLLIQEYKALHERELISETIERVLSDIDWENEFDRFCSVEDFGKLSTALKLSLKNRLDKL